MARDHARLLVSIWTDPEWTSLAGYQQTTYLALLGSVDLSWCGVAPLIPRRLVGASSDLTERRVRQSLDELAARRLLVIDTDTAEVAVRTYVRHDGILKQPNVTKAMVRALDRIHSDLLRSAVISELGRLLKDEPNLRGWATIRAAFPEVFDQINGKGSGNPSRNPSGGPK